MFTVLYLLVLFLLVLNFLLAIIVEAYMQLRAAISAKETEQSFFTDLLQSVQSLILGKIRGWPSPRFLGAELAVWQAKNSVSYHDLYRTLLFRDPASINRSENLKTHHYITSYSKFRSELSFENFHQLHGLLSAFHLLGASGSESLRLVAGS